MEVLFMNHNNSIASEAPAAVNYDFFWFKTAGRSSINFYKNPIEFW